MGAWAISFFLPAVKIDVHDRRPAPGWAVAFDALVLLVVPVKGAWLGFMPLLWTVFINLFMLLIPVEIKAIKEGAGRLFSILFAIATAVPVAFGYYLRLPLLVGFYVWEFSMIIAAGLLIGAAWKDKWAVIPTGIVAALLIALPVYRARSDVWLTQQVAGSTARGGGSQPNISPLVQPTSLRLEPSPNPSVGGRPVTFSATISAPNGAVPDGTVTFGEAIGYKILGSSHTSGGIATLSTSDLSIGRHVIQASFFADTRNLYQDSRATLVQIVNDPKDRETQTMLSVVKSHFDREKNRIDFTVRARVALTRSGAPVMSGSVVLSSARWMNVPLQLNQRGEASFTAYMPMAQWKGYRFQALYEAAKGFRSSSATLQVD